MVLAGTQEDGLELVSHRILNFNFDDGVLAPFVSKLRNLLALESQRLKEGIQQEPELPQPTR